MPINPGRIYGKLLLSPAYILTIPLCIFASISTLRKLLEQREEELQQQVRSLRLNEATMTRTNAELSHRAQQLDTRLTIVEVELSKAKEEVLLARYY